MQGQSDSSSAPIGGFQGLGLSQRIALAMFLSLLAIQAQAFLQIYLLAKPEFRLTGTRWLAETTASTVRDVLATPIRDRSEMLRQKSLDTGIKMAWSPIRPADKSDDSSSALTQRLKATLRARLGSDAKAIQVAISELSYRFPINHLRVVIDPVQAEASLGEMPVRDGEPDILMPAGVHVSVETRDGTWVSIEPVGFSDGAFGGSLPIAPLAAGGLIIAIASTWMARRMVAPLDRLVTAAERIGTAREPVRVDTEGLHEFAAVARAFEEMQQRLLKFVDDRTQMLAAISHDLRSSLTRLRLAAEPYHQDDNKSALAAEIDDMESMVDSTLAFATGEAQLIPNQPTDVAALLISLVDEATDAERACSYSGPDHVETMAHPVSLKRAFRNIIDNSIKYGKVARISLTASGASIQIAIADDGPGIPEASMEDVFTPFKRLDPARGHQTPGTGLGLTIARDVIQSHGGTIELANRIEGGLNVMITLPRR